MKILKGAILLSIISVLFAANTLPLREIRTAFLLPSQLPPYAVSTLNDLIFYSGAGDNYVFNTQLQTGELLFPQLAANCENSESASTSSRLLFTSSYLSYYFCYAQNVIYILDFYQDFAIVGTLAPTFPLRVNSVLQNAGLNDTNFVVVLSWDQIGSELIYINATSNTITNNFQVNGVHEDPLINFAVLNTTNFVATGRTSSTTRNLYILPFWGNVSATLLTSFPSSDSFIDQLVTSYTKAVVEYVTFAQNSANLSVYSIVAQEVIGTVLGVPVVSTTYNNISWSQAVFSPSFESDNFYVFYQGSLTVYHPDHLTLTPISQTPLPYFSQIGPIFNAQMYCVAQNNEIVYLQLGNYLYTTTNVNVTVINLYPSSNIFQTSFIFGTNFSSILTHTAIFTYNNAGQFVYANFMNFVNSYKDNVNPQYFWYVTSNGNLYQYNILTNTTTLFQTLPASNYEIVVNNINATVAGVNGYNGFLSCNKKTAFTFNLGQVPNLPIFYAKETQIALFPNCGPTPKVTVVVVGCNNTICSNPIAIEYNSSAYSTYYVVKDSSYISQMDANTLVVLESDYLNGNTITVFNPGNSKYSYYQANVEDVLLIDAFAYPLLKDGAYVYYVYEDDLDNVYFGISSQYIQYQTLLSQPNEFTPMVTSIQYSGAGTNSFTLSQSGLYTSITYYQIISL